KIKLEPGLDTPTATLNNGNSELKRSFLESDVFDYLNHDQENKPKRTRVTFANDSVSNSNQAPVHSTNQLNNKASSSNRTSRTLASQQNMGIGLAAYVNAPRIQHARLPGAPNNQHVARAPMPMPMTMTQCVNQFINLPSAS